MHQTLPSISLAREQPHPAHGARDGQVRVRRRALREERRSTRGTKEMQATSPKTLFGAERARVSAKAAGEGGFHCIREGDAGEFGLHTSAVCF